MAATMLLDRDYRWCAETMLNKFASRALDRAERHAWEMLGDGSPGGYDIWTRVAATIRQIEAKTQAARQYGYHAFPRPKSDGPPAPTS